MSVRVEAAPSNALASRWQLWRRAFYRFRRSSPSLVGLLMVTLLLLAAFFAPLLTPYPADVTGAVHTTARFIPPSAGHWLGTNELGQDMLSLLIAGSRVSLLAGVAVVIAGTLVGGLVGAIAGYFGGWIDEVLMRLADLTLTIPGLILAMAVAAALGPGLFNMIVAIAASWWPGYARLVRAEVMGKKGELFVVAAQATGASPSGILFRHILPNIASPVIVKMSLDVGFAILTVASLGFIGIGVKPPTPEWGLMLSVARGNLPVYWWTAIFPGMAIFVAVLGFNLLGDGLRDVVDPKAQG